MDTGLNTAPKATETTSGAAPGAESGTETGATPGTTPGTATGTESGAATGAGDRAAARCRDRGATTRRILEAATLLFAEHGYDQVTMRMIANAADANVALVNRYFGSKAGLFAEVLASRSALEAAIEGDMEGLPARLAAHVTRRISAETGDPVARAIDRAGSSPEIRVVLRRRVESAILGPLLAKLEGPGARERAALAAAIVLGGGALRRNLGQDAAQELDMEALERRLTALFTACLTP